MVRITYFSAVLGLIVSVSCAGADGQATKPGPKPGKRPAFSHGPGLELLREEAVQKDLGVSDEQRTEIQQLDQRETERQKALNVTLKSLSGDDRQAAIDAFRAEVKDGIKRILNPKQRDRFRGIRIQYNGTIILAEPEIAAALGLSKEQAAKLREMRESYFPRLNEMMKVRHSDAEDAKESLAKFHEDYSNMMLGVLTVQQREKFDEMKGEEFDMAQLKSSSALPKGARRESP